MSLPEKVSDQDKREGSFYQCPGAPLENSRLARQMDPEICSRIEFPGPGKLTKGQLITKKDESVGGLLFSAILEGSVKKDSLLAWNYQTLSWNDQLEQFFSFQQLSPEEIQLRWQVCVDILTVLRSTFPECDASAYGSVLTGLRESDADVYMMLDPDRDNCKTLKQFKGKNHLKTIAKVKAAVGRILQNAENPHLRCPFVSELVVGEGDSRKVTFKLSEINLKVELAIATGNRLHLQHSKLLQFYLNYDPRVKHLIMFLQHWTEFHGLSGPDKLKDFPVNMLVVVYLARKKIVPSVILLQTLADLQRMKQGIEENPDKVLGEWDTSFCADPELISNHFKPSGHRPTKQQYSDNLVQCFLDLLAGFFKMITKTDFPSVVFCPQLGKIVQKSDLSSAGLKVLDKLPITPLTTWRKRKWEQDRTDKFSRAINIQDPFMLNHSLRGFPVNILDKLELASSSTLKILENGPTSFRELFVLDENACQKSNAELEHERHVVRMLKISK